MNKRKEKKVIPEQTMQKGYLLVEILRRELHGEEQQPLPEGVSCESIMAMAKKHSVDILAYQGLVKIPEYKEILREKWKQQIFQCTMQGKVQLAERNRLYDTFSKQGIQYLPLKGCVLKEWYDQPEVRQMSDLDILINSCDRDFLKQIMNEQGYELLHESSHHDVYCKKPWMTVELHHKMLDASIANHSKYDEIWEWAYEAPLGSHRFHLKADDFYLFFIEHFAKHYYNSGCGIRFLMDTYVLLKKIGSEFNEKHLEEKLKERDLLEFRKEAEILAQAWFGGNKTVCMNTKMERIVLEAGIYGTRTQKKRNRINTYMKSFRSRKVGKFFYCMSMVFLGYQDMCLLYPVLKKIPVLLPFCWIHRTIRTLFTKRERIKTIWNEVSKVEKELF